MHRCMWKKSRTPDDKENKERRSWVEAPAEIGEIGLHLNIGKTSHLRVLWNLLLLWLSREDCSMSRDCCWSDLTDFRLTFIWFSSDLSLSIFEFLSNTHEFFRHLSAVLFRFVSIGLLFRGIIQNGLQKLLDFATICLPFKVILVVPQVATLHSCRGHWVISEILWTAYRNIS